MKYSNTAATEDTDEPEREYYDEHKYDTLPGYILEINNDVDNDTETYNEAISDYEISNNLVDIVLSFKADTSDEENVNVAQVLMCLIKILLKSISIRTGILLTGLLIHLSTTWTLVCIIKSIK